MSALLTAPSRSARADPREALLLESLFNASRGFKHRLRPELERQNLTSPMFWALHQLVLDGPMTVGRIAGLCVVTPANVSSALERLGGRGLIVRQTSPQDRRKSLISPTARGRAVHREVWQRMARLLVRTLDGVSDDDFAATVAVLRRLAASAGPGLVAVAEEAR